jgi:CRISPR/Cas system-associated exonuclease Cas4 (RecB family)
MIISLPTYTPSLDIEKLELTPYGLGAWSYSKVKCLKNCPLQFYLRYVLKIKPLTKPPISLVTEVGKAAHRVLEFVVKGKSISDSFKATRKEFDSILSEDQWTDNVLNLEYSMSIFREKMDVFEKRNPIKRVFPEIKVAVDRDWKPTGFFSEDCHFRGVIDLALQMDNKDALYIDHKTGAPVIMGVRSFQEQLNTYKVLFHYGIEKTTGGQAGIHFIREGETLLDNYANADEIENSLKGRVEFSIEGAIDTVKEIGFFKHKRGQYCNYCDFNEDCKAGVFKPIVEDSKKWFPIKIEAPKKTKTKKVKENE